MSGGIGPQKSAQDFHFHPHFCVRVIFLAQSIREELMAYMAHAAQVDLRLGDAARELLGCRVGTGPSDLTRKRFHVF
jgi:hypothetical protein